jgi:hypothetical protein
MPKIMADHNAGGHLKVLLGIWSSPDWSELWSEVACEIKTFEDLGLDRSVADNELWRVCQERQIVLITGNRNSQGEDSLEMTIRREGAREHLPVMTIADPEELIRNREYAERVAARLLEFLQVLPDLCGAGRLYLP